ncbi:MAG TPA: S8 family serine peptidase [Steroidobacteraceae bacterium]|nr:S8 family serine peptidase [Steroidobacteraceae bacterium]
MASTLLLGFGGPGAHSQIVPSVLPQLPHVDLPLDAGKVLQDVDRELDPQQLVDLRRLKIRDLLRAHPRELEADPHGAPIVRSELLAFDPSEAAMHAAQDAGLSVAREQVLDGLDTRIVVLRVPEGVSTRRALKRLRTLDPAGTYDYNHIYLESGAATGLATTATAPGALPLASIEQSAVRIGLVDSGIDASHRALRRSTIHAHGCGGQIVPSAHGTEVASLLVGSGADLEGAAPGGELFAADAYCGRATGGAIDTVADALAWMARERVPVINVSLVGPANKALEGVIRLLTARGHIVVAAVGNDGPAAPPLYPAAYANVIGVTAVDPRRRVLPEAARGEQVDFAAPGSQMYAADDHSSLIVVRGTSFAAPIVAGLLAASLQQPDPAAALHAIDALAQSAVDLGTPGTDHVYGKGLVGESVARRPPGITSSGIKP